MMMTMRRQKFMPIPPPDLDTVSLPDPRLLTLVPSIERTALMVDSEPAPPEEMFRTGIHPLVAPLVTKIGPPKGVSFDLFATACGLSFYRGGRIFVLLNGHNERPPPGFASPASVSAMSMFAVAGKKTAALHASDGPLWHVFFTQCGFLCASTHDDDPTTYQTIALEAIHRMLGNQ